MEHLDLDALCDVLAGVDADSSHLATCAQCTAQLAELERAQASVTAVLRGLPAPEAPAALGARLDAAIAAERIPKVATATVTPLHAAPSRRTSWVPWAGGVAAACALVVGFVALRPGSSPRTTGAQGTDLRAESQQLPTSSTGNSYSAKGDLLARALPQLLAGMPQKAAAPLAQGAATADPLAGLRDRATLASCLAGLTDPADTALPLALDYAAFDGQPALVVVYPATKAGKVDVFVVGAGCTQQDSKLLFFTRLTKP